MQLRRPNPYLMIGVALVALVSSARVFSQSATAAPGAQPTGAGSPGVETPAPGAATDAVSRPELRVGLSLGQTDNLDRDTTQIQSGMAILDLGFNVRTNHKRITGALVGDLEFYRYDADNLLTDHEVSGAVDGKLGVSLVPQRLVWEFEENYGQTRIDPLAPIGPNNRQRTVVVSTGPRLDLPLGGRNSLELAAHIAERRFENSSQLDSRTESEQFEFTHAIDAVTQFGVILDNISNQFDTDQQGYTFRILSVVYAKTLATGSAQIRIGRGQVEIGSESSPTTVGRIEWRRDIGARSRLNLWAGRELTDAGELFRYGGILGGETTPSDLSALTNVFGAADSRLHGVVLSPNPFRHSSAGTRVDLVGRTVTVRIGASIARDIFEQDDTLDNDSKVLEWSLGWDFARLWNGDVRFSAVRQHFAVTGRDNDDRVGRLTVTRKLATRSRVSMIVERNQRINGVSPYDENVYLVSISHDFSR